MKLSCVVATLATATASASSAKFLRSHKNLDGAIQRKLLEKATRVADRRLEEGEAQNEEEAQDEQWEQNMNLENTAASYELQFKFCLNLPAYNERFEEELANQAEENANNGDNNNQNIDLSYYIASGAIGTQASYVLFDICEIDAFGNPFSGNNYTGATDASATATCDGGTYMVDLPTYMEIITTEFMTQDEQDYDDAYCTACAESYDYCQ